MTELFVLVAALVAVAAGGSPSVPLPQAPGVQMPVMGLGTGSYGQLGPDGRVTFGEYWNDTTAAQAVAAFIKLGGRRLDCSLKVCLAKPRPLSADHRSGTTIWPEWQRALRRPGCGVATSS